MAQVSETRDNVMSAPCLIGLWSAVSDTSPSYLNPMTAPDGSVASVDMVRVSLKFAGDGGQWLMEHADTFPCDDMASWSSKVAIGRYLTVWRFALGDSSVTLGVGLFDKSCKVNMQRGFCEFNPNKVGGDSRLYLMIERIARHVASASVSRFDFAYDVSVDRNVCRISKDRRTYQAVISDGMTEYLGHRNAAGFVKLYDKRVESGLSVPLTRVELTCSGAWTGKEVVENWPQVHRWSVPDGTRGWVRTVGMLLADRVCSGQEVESYIAALGRESKAKVRECLRTSMIELTSEVADHVVNQAKSWEILFCGR